MNCSTTKRKSAFRRKYPIEHPVKNGYWFVLGILLATLKYLSLYRTQSNFRLVSALCRRPQIVHSSEYVCCPMTLGLKDMEVGFSENARLSTSSLVGSCHVIGVAENWQNRNGKKMVTKSQKFQRFLEKGI